ncbi:ead/Ea22-like family protein [Enterobacter roggenkampii]
MSNIDKRALREAAEKATLGRIGDRIDGSGSIKYQCFGNDGSLVLQTDHKNMEYGFIGENSEADELFFRMCEPATVLALLDELEAKDKRIIDLEATTSHSNAGWKEAHEQEARAEAAEKRIAEQRETLLAARSYVMQCARMGDAHANGVLQAIDRAAAGKGE